ncbi:MAG: histidine phosphatase family protein [Sphingomonas sp.]|uniref:histidine phosphatase family protein n=1 Tax=Sphingomonas sp. TaxID=28214 RepID=UPI001AD00904|nr:histidine phosphatase family protein [Sphingomonas sp.]MBN8816319.1 histidine phosphatase family protein [Sphingomonas sp.]
MRFIIARHAETIYNAGARMQGNGAHTPLTRAGIVQAEAMGAALAEHLRGAPDIDIWASPAGRTLQTVSIIAEHLGRDFFDVRTDPRLLEIDVGDWAGRLYADVVAEQGAIMCPDRRVFTAKPPAGEWYPAIATRLRSWLDDLDQARNVVVISHGLALRVLRGMLSGGEVFEGVPLAKEGSQGSIFEIDNGEQRELYLGKGQRFEAA